ncbi:ABC transporter family substrate-binding protein [Corynebacterium mayonis]|uniref:ABC transporter family substrate-binding protein n=1 Tax=Corynebacterium mayonis TaxID=3062461 RepID=UPI0031404CE4
MIPRLTKSRTRRTAMVRRRFAALLASCALVASCAANPGPPPLVEEQPEETSTEATRPLAPSGGTRTQVQVGVDPLRNGLNPHLAADESEVVESIADLVLPSAFVDGKRNADVIEVATVLPTSPSEDVAMTVRYVIADEAQWSDGTPITGADFTYLWRGMSATPSVVDPSGYRAISNVRVSGPGGKVVDVDFRALVAEWRVLFSHLLPAHLFSPDAADFATALSDDIPASAGRFMVVNVDRGRSTITLNRNDRFWGANPAKLDILTLVGVQDTTQIAGQLRVGQLSFVDMVPQETTSTVVGLVPGVQTQLYDAPRDLGITLSTTSPLLGTVEAREELRSLIDVALLARVAARRSTDVTIAPHRPASAAAPATLAAASHEIRPLRVGVDPADPHAAAAARSLVDLLASRGVSAQVITTDFYRISAQDLPAGELDMVVNWRVRRGASPAIAGELYCQPDTYRAGNLSGLCTPETEELAERILTGEIPGGKAREEADAALEANVVWVALLTEKRLRALTDGIVGPHPMLTAWPGGVSTAATWRSAIIPDRKGREVK